jgi:hypothetical protein
LAIGLGQRRWTFFFSSYSKPTPCINPITVSGQLAIFRTIGEVRRNLSRASPILSCTSCCANLLALRFLFHLSAMRNEHKKNRRIFVTATANEPRFAYKGRIQQRIKYSANTIGYTWLIVHRYFQNLPINWAVLTGNGNTANIRWRRINTAEQCPASQSKANTQQLALLLTHLSFRWTLPLRNVFPPLELKYW